MYIQAPICLIALVICSKFLIDKDGKVVQRYASTSTPAAIAGEEMGRLGHAACNKFEIHIRPGASTCALALFQLLLRQEPEHHLLSFQLPG